MMGTSVRSVCGGAKQRRGRGRRLGLGAGRMRSPVAVTCIVFELHMWRRLRPLEVLRKSKEDRVERGSQHSHWRAQVHRAMSTRLPIATRSVVCVFMFGNKSSYPSSSVSSSSQSSSPSLSLSSSPSLSLPSAVLVYVVNNCPSPLQCVCVHCPG